jgi:hypothetical protein
LPDGTASAPALAFADDQNSGILSPANNELAFATSGTQRLVIDSSGNCGIGAAAPAAKLDVAGNQIFTATNPQIQFNAGGPIIRLPSANTLAFLSDSSNERMRIDSLGNMAVGATNPQARLEVRQDSSTAYDSSDDNAQKSGTSSICITNHNGSNNTFSQLVFDTANSNQSIARIVAIRTGTSSNDLAFVVEGSNTKREAMRIDSSGRLLVGTTTNLGAGGLTIRPNITEGSPQIAFNRSSTTNTSFCQLFKNGGTDVGSISYTNTATAFNTSSDYRLKENVVNLDGAITRVKQLQPKRFNFIINAGATVDGFLAHEAQTVVPEAVTGTHNEVDDDGNAVMQGIDQSKLVPLLTAALQEAIAKIETLETKVAALEAQ